MLADVNQATYECCGKYPLVHEYRSVHAEEVAYLKAKIRNLFILNTSKHVMGIADSVAFINEPAFKVVLTPPLDDPKAAIRRTSNKQPVIDAFIEKPNTDSNKNYGQRNKLVREPLNFIHGLVNSVIATSDWLNWRGLFFEFIHQLYPDNKATKEGIA